MSDQLYETFVPGKSPIKLLLKGASGSRKTTKAVQFPKPVLFNFDNNLSGLRNLDPKVVAALKIVNPAKDKDGKEVVGIKVFDNFVKQLEVVLADSTPRTIIVDSLTTMAGRLIDKILGSDSPDAKMQIQHWGDFSRYMKWMGDEILCNPGLDKNFIFIAHENIEKDKLTENVMLTLNVGGSMKSSFGLYFSDVWRCYAKTGTGPTQYRVRVAPTSQYDAKCSLTGLPEDFLWEEQAANIFKQLS